MISILKYSSMFAVVLMIVGSAFAQTDPGVRNGTVDAGFGLRSITRTSPPPDPNKVAYFGDGQTRFNTVETVTGATNSGLGPRFNLNQCSACHAQPAIGGSSPSSSAYPFLGPNPQSQVLANNIAYSPNTLPYFVSASGPVVEARFPFFFTGMTISTKADGGVHDIFTVTGNPNASSCTLTQPHFNTAASLNDIIFRIPTPVFGAGYIENIGEDTLINFFNGEVGNPFGVSGAFNLNGNDGTISRFGWKAQNKSTLLFSGEAYNVEMGITNELFQNERPNPDEEHNLAGLPSGCLNLTGTGYPEDTTPINTSNSGTAASSDITMFAIFMRLLEQPTARPSGYSTASTTVTAASIARGQTAFSTVGCAACHAPSLTTDTSSIDSELTHATANLYSDLEIHHMGGLADNVQQGMAMGDQFRTAPLWGVGQRIFFLHDGRTSDLPTAISDHCLAPGGGGMASEACTAEANFAALPATSGGGSTTSQQDVLNFLRSL